MNLNKDKKEKWWLTTPAIIGGLILVFPLGVYQTFKSNWSTKNKTIAIGIAFILFSFNYCSQIKEEEQIAIQKAEEQKQEELEKQERQKQIQQQRLEQEKRNQEYRETQISKYGITEEDFGNRCRTLITMATGSRDFGFWNAAEIQEIGGSLFTQDSVYGKNAFGTKVEKRFKCWSEGNQGVVKIENIGTQFH